MNEEIGHMAFVEIEKAWREFTSDQTWEGVRTLKFALEKAMIGKEPDPQADGDEIVKLLETWLHIAYVDGIGSKRSRDAGAALARAIEAENQARKEEHKMFRSAEKYIYGQIEELRSDHHRRLNGHDITIDTLKNKTKIDFEALRKLFRNHESRLGELDTSTDERTSLVDLVHISSKESLEAVCKIEDLERKVEKLEDRVENTEDALPFHASDIDKLKRKVEELEKENRGLWEEGAALSQRVSNHIAGKKEPKLEPPEPTEQHFAKDKHLKYTKHKLIPGRSVLRFFDNEIPVLFLGLGNDNEPVIFRADSGAGYYGPHLWSVKPSELTWLFDLPLPKGGTQ